MSCLLITMSSTNTVFSSTNSFIKDTFCSKIPIFVTGKKSYIWFGPNPRIFIMDPELIKEILSRPDEFQKPHPEAFRDSIVGGLVISEGHKWETHRQIISPAFNVESMKVSVDVFTLVTLIMFYLQNLK